MEPADYEAAYALGVGVSMTEAVAVARELGGAAEPADGCAGLGGDYEERCDW